MINSKQLKDLELCKNCVLGKTHRLSFKAAIHRTKATLDYIHSDLWGSSKVHPLLSKSHYFLSIIDDFSRKVWIKFLKIKDEAFTKLRGWVIWIENQT